MKDLVVVLYFIRRLKISDEIELLELPAADSHESSPNMSPSSSVMDMSGSSPLSSASSKSGSSPPETPVAGSQVNSVVAQVSSFFSMWSSLRSQQCWMI